MKMNKCPGCGAGVMPWQEACTQCGYRIWNTPAIPGPSASDPNMAELCFRNGEAHMKEKVIALLMDHKTWSNGVCHQHMADIICRIESL